MTPVSPEVVAQIVAEAERKLKMATPVQSTDSVHVSNGNTSTVSRLNTCK